MADRPLAIPNPVARLELSSEWCAFGMNWILAELYLLGSSNCISKFLKLRHLVLEIGGGLQKTSHPHFKKRFHVAPSAALNNPDLSG